MHLGWFTNYLTPSWNGDFSGRAADSWMSGDFHVNLARRLEEARFDYLLLEDSSYVSNAYGGDFDLELRQMARAPKNDPMPLAAAIAREWPRWYAANRAVIGADPDLIVIGQVLTPPSPQEATP